MSISASSAQRLEVVRLGARYAESAAWLYEDSGNLARARYYWTSRAMEWAYEGDDKRMLAWTIFRRSQQAVAARDTAQVIGLAQAARRDDEYGAAPTRAAIRVQEASNWRRIDRCKVLRHCSTIWAARTPDVAAMRETEVNMLGKLWMKIRDER